MQASSKLPGAFETETSGSRIQRIFARGNGVFTIAPSKEQTGFEPGTSRISILVSAY